MYVKLLVAFLVIGIGMISGFPDSCSVKNVSLNSMVSKKHIVSPFTCGKVFVNETELSIAPNVIYLPPSNRSDRFTLMMLKKNPNGGYVLHWLLSNIAELDHSLTANKSSTVHFAYTPPNTYVNNTKYWFLVFKQNLTSGLLLHGLHPNEFSSFNPKIWANNNSRWISELVGDTEITVIQKHQPQHNMHPIGPHTGSQYPHYYYTTRKPYARPPYPQYSKPQYYYTTRKPSERFPQIQYKYHYYTTRKPQRPQTYRPQPPYYYHTTRKPVRHYKPNGTPDWPIVMGSLSKDGSGVPHNVETRVHNNSGYYNHGMNHTNSTFYRPNNTYHPPGFHPPPHYPNEVHHHYYNNNNNPVKGKKNSANSIFCSSFLIFGLLWGTVAIKFTA